MDIKAKSLDFENHLRVDRIGIVASILCAIHCAITPVLLIVLPNFAKVWAHPATHWGMALVVIPIAVCMIVIGYKKHARQWIVVTGFVGIILIIIGSILPYTDAKASSSMDTVDEGVVTTASVSQGSVEQGGLSPAGSAPLTDEAVTSADIGCIDYCCPSIVVNEKGENSIYIPSASIVTSFGGLCLIMVHGGNLYCCCSRRRKNMSCECV